MAESTNNVLLRLMSHIAQMAPHQKKREAGKLLIEAASEIEELEKEVLSLEKALIPQKTHG